MIIGCRREVLPCHLSFLFERFEILDYPVSYGRRERAEKPSLTVKL